MTSAGMASLRRGKFVGVTGKLLSRLVHPSHADGEIAASLRAMAARVGGAAFLRQQQAILDRRDLVPRWARSRRRRSLLLAKVIS